MEEEGLEPDGDSRSNGHQSGNSEQIVEKYVVISSSMPETFERALKRWATMTDYEKGELEMYGDPDYRIYRVTEVSFS